MHLLNVWANHLTELLDQTHQRSCNLVGR